MKRPTQIMKIYVSQGNVESVPPVFPYLRRLKRGVENVSLYFLCLNKAKHFVRILRIIGRKDFGEILQDFSGIVA